MRYMFLIYTKENSTGLAPEAAQQLTNAHWAVIQETKKLGIFCGADPLQSTATATTIRMQDGKPVTTDGPYAETKEQIAGYYILDCKDLDEALAWAARIPSCCGGEDGCIEVRPLREIPSRPEALRHAQYVNSMNG